MPNFFSTIAIIVLLLFLGFYRIGVQDAVYDWLIKFTDLGVEGLKDKPIPGRPKKLKNNDTVTLIHTKNTKLF